jgi:hypothetical protein
MKQRVCRQSDPGTSPRRSGRVSDPYSESFTTTSSYPGEVCLEALNRSFTQQKGNQMLDFIEQTKTTTTAELPIDPPASSTGKRDRIDQELRADPQRSDREIARIVGCDHKTVGAARAKLSPPNSPQPPTATERRHMLIEGCKDFDAKYPPGPSEVATAEEAVDDAIADGKVSTGADDEMVQVEFPRGNVLMRRDQAAAVQAAMDQVEGHRLRDRKARLAEADAAGEKNEERTILGRREEVTIQHDTENGAWIIRQRRWPDEDALIIIDNGDIHEFVDVLTDHLGYGRFP